MLRTSHLFTILLALGVSVGLSGCRVPADDDAQDTTPADNQDADHEHGEHGDHDHDGHADHEHDESPEAIAKGLSELSAEDRKLAEAQQTCPVGEEPLGAHGKPLKIDLDGQTVFICCEACEEALRANPEKYLAKIGKKPADE